MKALKKKYQWVLIVSAMWWQGIPQGFGAVVNMPYTALEIPDLMGVWISPCIRVDDKDDIELKSEKEKITFDDSGVGILEVTEFFEKGCKGESEVFSETFQLKKSIGAVDRFGSTAFVATISFLDDEDNMNSKVVIPGTAWASIEEGELFFYFADYQKVTASDIRNKAKRARYADKMDNEADDYKKVVP